MKPSTTIQSPVSFIVEPYVPGFTIDFTMPAVISDLEKFRQSFDFSQFHELMSDAELAAKVGQALVDFGIAEHEADFATSLHAYTGLQGMREQLEASLRKLHVYDVPETKADALRLLFEKTGCLTRGPHYSVRMHCHTPGETTVLESGVTHFGYVLDGECTSVEAKRSVTLSPNTFFCIAGGAEIIGIGRCVIVTHFGYKGITQYGGEVEGWGRLNYIDGCTDTLLVPPLKKGDPCYNALYFPAATEQTQHAHPSLRCGVVIAGEGVCQTPFGAFPLKKGSVFFLPPETYHSFHTGKMAGTDASALTVVAFHPDSDFGPTDADHPMVNRTYFKFLHRITSSEKELRTAEPVA